VAVLASGLLLHQDSSNQRSVGGRQCCFFWCSTSWPDLKWKNYSPPIKSTTQLNNKPKQTCRRLTHPLCLTYCKLIISNPAGVLNTYRFLSKRHRSGSSQCSSTTWRLLHCTSPDALYANTASGSLFHVGRWIWRRNASYITRNSRSMLLWLISTTGSRHLSTNKTAFAIQSLSLNSHVSRKDKFLNVVVKRLAAA